MTALPCFSGSLLAPPLLLAKMRGERVPK